MRHGLLLLAGAHVVQSWIWADSITICPIEFLIQPGMVLVDLSQCSPVEAQMVIEAVTALPTAAEREALLAAYPQITLPAIPDAPPDHVMMVQPGYRRICCRPTKEWHDKEIVARLRANQRIEKGEDAPTVIEQEFTHLSKDEQTVRLGMKQADSPFPLPPMVSVVEQRQKDKDGAQIVTTLRRFPFHEPIADL